MNVLLRVLALIYFHFFVTFVGFTQVPNYAIFGDSMFVSICVEKDTSWTIGNVVQRNDSILFQQKLTFDFRSGELKYYLHEEAQPKEFGILIDEIEKVEGDFYNPKLREYLFRLLERTWREADILYQVDLEKSFYYFEAIKNLIDFIESPELEFIKKQLALFDKDIDFLGQMALNSYKEKDWDKTLFYSRVYRLMNRTINNLSFEVQEAEMDAILALDFSGIYVPYIEENVSLYQKLSSWKQLIPIAQIYIVTKKCNW